MGTGTGMGTGRGRGTGTGRGRGRGTGTGTGRGMGTGTGRGRGRGMGMVNDKRKGTTVRFDEAERQRLADHASALGWDVTQVVRAAVKDYLDGGVKRYRVTMRDTSCVVLTATNQEMAMTLAAELLPTEKHGSVSRVEEVTT